MSDNTIKFHLRNILDKLHVHNRAEVVAYASRYGPAPQNGVRLCTRVVQRSGRTSGDMAALGRRMDKRDQDRGR